MTLVQSAGSSPTSNYAVAPIGGGGLKGALIDTGISIVETVITNYLTNKFSGKAKTGSKTEVQGQRKTFWNKNTRYRSRNSSRRISYNKGFRSWKSKPSRRKRYNYFR